jgi:epoxyqueuosine reductase QueG
MITAEMIKQKAKELGAGLCGIGDIKHFIGDNPQHNPLSILPNAKCIIGFGIPIPKGLFLAMEEKRQYFNYTNLAVKYTDESFAEIFLLKMGAMIEDAGYDACLQRSIPGFKVKGDKTTNPEVSRIYELEFSSPVSKDKPAPDVIIDYNKAAKICGLGDVGMHGKIISPKYGSFLRWVFIITDMPLECDAVFEENLCDRCGKCLAACPGKAIGESGVDSWQCSVYYRGAHKSNPFITEKTLENHPEREAILNGEKRFSREEARLIYKELDFLPKTHFGYLACLCGKACETVCYKHLKEQGKI